jgi:hypothetical protein
MDWINSEPWPLGCNKFSNSEPGRTVRGPSYILLPEVVGIDVGISFTISFRDEEPIRALPRETRGLDEEEDPGTAQAAPPVTSSRIAISDQTRPTPSLYNLLFLSVSV